MWPKRTNLHTQLHYWVTGAVENTNTHLHYLSSVLCLSKTDVRYQQPVCSLAPCSSLICAMANNILCVMLKNVLNPLQSPMTTLLYLIQTEGSVVHVVLFLYKIDVSPGSLANTPSCQSICIDLTSGQSQWSNEACRKHLAAGLYFREANSARPKETK